jgi:Na+/proline symporter
LSALDWSVLCATLAGFVLYGLWRSRGERNLDDYLLAGRRMPWPAVALSVMATQASAITFLSTPGQGYGDGLRFVQFYFGLPLAMIVICVTAIPIYRRLRVFTAYEYLERRFDGKTRSLTAGLFLLQRSLAAGLTIYAPALVLSVILGWDVRWTCALLGLLAVIYTASGGSKAVAYSARAPVRDHHRHDGRGVRDRRGVTPERRGWSARGARGGVLHRLNAIDLRFDPRQPLQRCGPG